MEITRRDDCPHCHGEIRDDAPMGLCPVCLIEMCFDPTLTAGERRPSGPPSARGSFGDYDGLMPIAQGGMGAVYKARDVLTGDDVAIKLLPGGALASPADVYLFRAEVEAVTKLAREHGNIVPIYDSGEHEGQPYFTMKLMTGGSLAEHLGRFHEAPRDAAALVETVANAVHYAHQRAILHRDLKPANILLDEHDKPFVADFGVARDEGRGITLRGPVGTPPYMAPEQLEGRTTALSDVYSMGVILYELTTGRLPFEGETEAELRDQIKNGRPQGPRRINPCIDPDLESIVLRCLEKNPEERYGSAEALARELRKYLNGEHIVAVSRAERAWRWCLLHSVAAALVFAAASFLVTMLSGAIAIARSEETSRRAQIEESNKVRAGLVAGSVLSYLRGLSDEVLSVAEDEKKLAGVLEHGLKREGTSPFALWYLQDATGRAQGEFADPPRPRIFGKSFAGRDYFLGAKELVGEAPHRTYVSSIHKSSTNDVYEFAISTPVYGSDHRWKGVLVALVVTKATLGSLVVDDGQAFTVLAGPRDLSDPDPATPPARHPDPPEYLIVRHPALTNGESRVLDDDRVRRLGRDTQKGDREHVEPWWSELPVRRGMTSRDDYQDPLGKTDPTYAGRRLAGFAPVGHTGFVVIVESRESDALRPEKKLARQLAEWAGIALVPGAPLVLLAALYDRWRRTRSAPPPSAPATPPRAITP